MSKSHLLPHAPTLYQPISSITVSRTDRPEPLPTMEGASRQAAAERCALQAAARYGAASNAATAATCTYRTTYEHGRRTVDLLIEGENPALAATAMGLEAAGYDHRVRYGELRLPLTKMEITRVPEREPADLELARRALAACDSYGGYTGPVVQTSYPGRFWIMLQPKQWIQEIVDLDDGHEYNVSTFRRAINAIAPTVWSL